MTDNEYRYIVVGGGLAAASAFKAIRGIDTDGNILGLGRETHLPYHRPPLSKKLWFGQKKTSEILVHSMEFYDENDIDFQTGVEVVEIDPAQRTVTDRAGTTYSYEKLLLATGGTPRRLDIPGGDLEGICYYRTLDDYKRLRMDAGETSTAVVIGGSFIGTEIAAALNHLGLDVTLVMRGSWPMNRVLPESLGMAIREDYTKRGVTFAEEDEPVGIETSGNGFTTVTKAGITLKSGIVVAGIGIEPAIELASNAGLEVGNGIVVNDLLQTSNPDIYAAGDNALFNYMALDAMKRVEHWDNALNQGKIAGMNMASDRKPYDYMPYFFSDMFDFGFEAVGEVSTKLDTFADWQEENAKGVVYYLRDNVVRGAMMCNVWDKVEDARNLIRSGGKVTEADLKGAIG